MVSRKLSEHQGISTPQNDATMGTSEHRNVLAEKELPELGGDSMPASVNMQEEEKPEGLDNPSNVLGTYPIDDLMIRDDRRTIYEINRRISDNQYIMNPDFQRDFIWNVDKQSKLIESVLMRIPLPVFYLAENKEGKMIVVDGLQRLTTFYRFLNDQFDLRLKGRSELNGKRFSDLSNRLKNRIEDFNLTLYIITEGVPETARMDIFERVNGGIPLTRQQMRNCLYMGEATKFLKNEANESGFLEATGHSLNKNTMRDREFVNRFCAFQILGTEDYRGDMDDFLAICLQKMNEMDDHQLDKLRAEFRQGLKNNLFLFGNHAFRKHSSDQNRRNVINASLWDVMSTTLSHFTTEHIKLNADEYRSAFFEMIEEPEFHEAISFGTSSTVKVRTRFERVRMLNKEILHADQN